MNNFSVSDKIKDIMIKIESLKEKSRSIAQISLDLTFLIAVAGVCSDDSVRKFSVLATALFSGSGWLASKHFERKATEARKKLNETILI
jgi:hypothetical protein